MLNQSQLLVLKVVYDLLFIDVLFNIFSKNLFFILVDESEGQASSVLMDPEIGVEIGIYSYNLFSVENFNDVRFVRNSMFFVLNSMCFLG